MWLSRSAASSHEVKAPLSPSKPLSSPTPDLAKRSLLIQACGVCHTDLHYREGGINDDFPFLLGHEAAGVVESVGPDVSDVKPGDFVILNWRAVCGDCRSCRRGRPQYCFATHNATQKMTLTDGTELSPALGIGAFVEKTLVAAGSVHQGRRRRTSRGGRTCSAAESWLESVQPSTPARSVAVTPSRSSVAVVSVTLPSLVHSWLVLARSSPSTWTTANSSGPRSSAPLTPSTAKNEDPVDGDQDDHRIRR